ncbi:MAG TPA: acetylxylan esterase [Thermomicrobiales bacterium]|nr:acetylxylan esterase [Thermomicrobiales bacterium]
MSADLAQEIDQWWERLDDDLCPLEATPEFEHDALRSHDLFDTYRVRMTSLDRYIIAAWLSVPKGDGPFPAAMYTPTYMSVVNPAPYEFRIRAITMNVISRGQRGADRPYAAAFPGHLTVGIDDPDRYIFRGVVADTIRAWEVLRNHPQVDTDRMAMIGTDLALLVNARRADAKAVHVTGSFWYRMKEIAAGTEAYPFEEINDHLRMWPNQEEAVARTLAHFDPQYQAERITARVLLNRDQASPTGNDAWFAPLASRLATGPTFLDMTHRGQTDYDAMDAWLSNELGMPAYPRSWTPQDLGAWSV